MTAKLTLISFTLVGLFVVGVLLNTAALPMQAQDKATTLRAVFEKLAGDNQPFTVQFATPLVALEALWTFPDDGYALGEVGADYVCFSQPWNNGKRLRCTPFANIVSVSFVTP